MFKKLFIFINITFLILIINSAKIDDLILKGRFDEAEKYCNKLKGEKQIEAYEKLANSFSEKGNSEKAKKYYEIIGNFYFDKKDLDDAEKYYEKAEYKTGLIKIGEYYMNYPENKIFKEHTSSIRSVAISPDNKYIVSGSDDGFIKLWNIISGKNEKTFKAHQIKVSFVKVTPDGKYIVSSGFEGSYIYPTIKLWDINTGSEIRKFHGYNGDSSISITPDGKYLISGSGYPVDINNANINLWDINTGEVIRIFKGHRIGVSSVDITPDGNYIISGGFDSTLKLWDLNTGKIIRTFPSGIIKQIVITPDGNYIVSGGSRMKLWNIKTGNIVREFDEYNGHASLVVTSDGKYIISGGNNNTIKIWDIVTGKIIKSFEGHRNYNNNSILSIALSIDNKYIVSCNGYEYKNGGGDNTIRLWIPIDKFEKAAEYFEKAEYKEGIKKIAESFINKGDYFNAAIYFEKAADKESLYKIPELARKIKIIAVIMNSSTDKHITTQYVIKRDANGNVIELSDPKKEYKYEHLEEMNTYLYGSIEEAGFIVIDKNKEAILTINYNELENNQYSFSFSFNYNDKEIVKGSTGVCSWEELIENPQCKDIGKLIKNRLLK
ncbi:MAG: hypothetical protein JXB50_14270 [Spirochaetes bacterium]|nr:hypothetical protein [Spirochaetota bacterium]